MTIAFCVPYNLISFKNFFRGREENQNNEDTCYDSEPSVVRCTEGNLEIVDFRDFVGVDEVFDESFDVFVDSWFDRKFHVSPVVESCSVGIVWENFLVASENCVHKNIERTFS